MRKLLKMAISLQYFRKEANDEVYFSHADKQSFLQVDTIFFDGVWPGMAKALRKICNIFAISQERSLEYLDFCYVHRPSHGNNFFHMGQSIQEWTFFICGRQLLKTFKVIWSA